MPVADFVTRCRPWLPEQWDVRTFAAIAPAVQERARTLAEVAPMVRFLFEEPEIDDGAWNKWTGKLLAFGEILDGAADAFAGCPWEAAALHEVLAGVGEKAGVPSLAKAQAPVRLAVTGREVGPPLFESLELLGRDRTVDRIRRARQRLG
jgi:glutamyl-tRNA synthetase